MTATLAPGHDRDWDWTTPSGATQTGWAKAWWPIGSVEAEYILEMKDRPGVFFIAHGLATAEHLIAGPIPDLVAAKVAFMLLTERNKP